MERVKFGRKFVERLMLAVKRAARAKEGTRKTNLGMCCSQHRCPPIQLLGDCRRTEGPASAGRRSFRRHRLTKTEEAPERDWNTRDKAYHHRKSADRRTETVARQTESYEGAE